MQTQFHLDELCGDVMNMSLNDDEDGDVPSKGGGSSNEVAGMVLSISPSCLIS